MSPSAPPAPRVHDANALPLGTRLAEFELLSLLGIGGFGIVYLAFDHALEREVAVKEYMPASLAGRTETMHVSLRSQSDAETFALGLRSFVNEARLLARFDHPSLLKVLRFWEANGTAYMAMPVMRGRTLKEQRVEQGRAPDEGTLRSMLEALLGALERLHGEGVYHRDIAPDNIQIEPDGHPVLLDFGAARRVLSDKTQSLTAILKPAYAPIEQYAETGSVKQGPWTDFYALGATLHYVLVGKPPAPATARAVFDESSALAGIGLPGYSAAFLQMVDWMLAPKPADRPQSVADLRQVLLGERQVPAPFLIEPAGDAWDKTQVLPHGLTAGDDATLVLPRTLLPASERRAVPVAITAPPLASLAPPATAQPLAAALPLSAAPGRFQPAPAAAAPEVPTPATPTAARSKTGAVFAAAAAALALAAFVFWPKSTPAPAPVPMPAMAADPGSSLPVASGSTPAPGAVLASAPAVMSGTAAPTATGATAVIAPAQTPVTSNTLAGPNTAAKATPELEVKTVSPTGVRAAPKAAGAAPVATNNKTSTAAATPALQSPSGTEAAVATPAAAPTSLTAPAPAAPGPSAAAAPAAVTRPAAAEGPAAPAPVAVGPEAKCAGRNALSYFVCMERECLRGSFAGHADCQAWRKEAKRE